MISLEDVCAAQQIIAGIIPPTPLIRLPHNTKNIFLKAENTQEVGSFKIRGAIYAFSKLTQEQKQKGVVTYSTGNHSQAVAWCAKKFHIPSIIVMSPDAPKDKVEATHSYGVQIEMVEGGSEARRKRAEELSKEKGLTMIPPFDDPHIIAGQGTIGLEIVAQHSPSAIQSIAVPIGGGGLISGIALAIKETTPDIRVVGVVPEIYDHARQSFHQTKQINLGKLGNTIADAIKTERLGELPFLLINRYVDDIVTVSEKEIARATLLAAFHPPHLLLEPAGALALAYALQETTAIAQNKAIIAVASGGNTTLERLSFRL